MFEIGQLTRLPLGYVGESGTRTISIDMKAWMDEYPGALIMIQVIRPVDRYKYPAAYTKTGDVIHWTVDGSEVMYAGKGLAQIALYNPDTKQEYKSRVVGTIVAESLDGFNDIMLENTDPTSKWVNKVLVAANVASYAQEKAEEVMNSIPQDYMALSWNVSALTEEVDGLNKEVDTLNQGGLNLNKAFIGEQVATWLDNHPQATTTVQDRSLTIDKMVVGTLGYVTPEMFGAKGDGVTNDTVAIQSAIDFSSENGVPVKIISKHLTDDLTVQANAEIIGEGDATLIKICKNETNYNVLKLLNNSSVSNVTIIGDRDENTASITSETTAEWGHCIAVYGDNVSIDNVRCLKANGDGIYIGTETGRPSDNCSVTRCVIDEARRNGISVVNARDFIIDSTIIKNVHGTDPQYAIDFEPNDGGEYCVGAISNIKIFDCLGGLSIYINEEQTEAFKIVCTNVDVYRIKGRYAIYANCNAYNNDAFYFDNINIIEPTELSTVFTQFRIRSIANNPTISYHGKVIGGKTGGTGLQYISDAVSNTNPVNIEIIAENGYTPTLSGVYIGNPANSNNVKVVTNLNCDISDKNDGTKVYLPHNDGDNNMTPINFDIPGEGSVTVKSNGKTSLLINILGSAIASLGSYVYVGYGEGIRQKITAIIECSNVTFELLENEQGFTMTNASSNYVSVSIVETYAKNIVIN